MSYHILPLRHALHTIISVYTSIYCVYIYIQKYDIIQLHCSVLSDVVCNWWIHWINCNLAPDLLVISSEWCPSSCSPSISPANAHCAETATAFGTAIEARVQKRKRRMRYNGDTMAIQCGYGSKIIDPKSNGFQKKTDPGPWASYWVNVVVPLCHSESGLQAERRGRALPCESWTSRTKSMTSESAMGPLGTSIGTIIAGL